MTTDDMREIEAALDEFARLSEQRYRGPIAKRPFAAQIDAARAKVLALIRQKLEGNAAQKPATFAQPAADFAQNDAGSVVSKGGPVHSVIITVDGKVTQFTQVTDDAEHERAVEAWRMEALEVSADDRDGEIIPKPEDVGTPHEWFCLRRDEIDEALRLMRARPATGKDGLQVQAAGDLLRATLKQIRREADNADESYSAGLHRAGDIIEAAERAWGR